MNYLLNNMTPAEHLKLHGSLPIEVIEKLIENNAKFENVDDIATKINEARGQFPQEDFMAGAISDLQTVVKRLRGDNREALLGIIEQLDDIAECTNNASYYGLGELDEAKDMAEALEN